MKNLAVNLKSKRFLDAIFIYFGYGFRFVSPLLLYPMLTRRLGAESFGVFVASYSLALTISTIVEYGFNLTGTREIAIAKTPEERGEITGKILSARLLLLPIAVVIGAGLVASNHLLRQNIAAALLAIVLGSAQGSTAFWYFQGMGKALVAVIFEVSGQLLALVATALWVKSGVDLGMALIFQASSATLAAVCGVSFMIREAPPQRLSLSDAGRALTSGFAIFLSRAALSLYTATSAFLIAAVSSPTQAALYGAAERVVGANVAILRPLSSITLPPLAKLANESQSAATHLGLKIAAIVSLFMAGISVALFAFSGPLSITLFGRHFSEASPVMKILSFTLPIVALNSVLGGQLLVALRRDRAIAGAAVLGAACSLIFGLPLAKSFGAAGMAWARVFVEVAIFATFATTIALSRTRGLPKNSNIGR